MISSQTSLCLENKTGRHKTCALGPKTQRQEITDAGKKRAKGVPYALL